MGRTLPRHDSTLGRFRSYFQLPQWEVAGLLRVTDSTYEHLEAGRRGFPVHTFGRLLVLVSLVPPDPPPNPAGYEPPPPLPGPLPPDVAGLPKLRYRLKYCRYHDGRLHREADTIAERIQALTRRAAATEALRARAAQPDTPPDTAQALAEVLARFSQIPAEPVPADLLAWHTKRAAAAGLEAEADALAAVLPPLPPLPGL